MHAFLIPGKQICFPEEATHCRIVSVGAAVDFEKENFNNSYAESDYIPLQKKAVGPLVLNHQVPVDKGRSLFLWLGVVFYKVSNTGTYEPLKGGALAVVEAGVVSPEPGVRSREPEVVSRSLEWRDVECVDQLSVVAVKRWRVKKVVVRRKTLHHSRRLKMRTMVAKRIIAGDVVFMEDG